ncbi:MAG: hypothetical protein ABEJ59_03960 [Halanaeroarchaeum sp.]
MATTGRAAAERTDADALTATLQESAFVHLVSHADGDAVAAAGLLVRALGSDTPFQVSVVRTRAAADRRIESTEGTAIALGVDASEADGVLTDESVALAAYDVANELGSPDADLAIAGALAGGVVPHGPALEAAEDVGLKRRPGVGIPTADLADGLAHSRLFHAGFSGEERQAGAFLAELDLPADIDDSARRTIASAVALDATEPPAPSRAAEAIQGALRPHVLPDGPFETAEGYADVLDALARTAPGLAIGLAMDRFDRTDVLTAWREHARSVHEALRLADRARHAGFVVLETTAGDAWTTARLARDFRSAEPTVLVVGDGEVALATTDADAAALLETVVDVDAVGGGTALASAETDLANDDLVDALSEAR